MGFPTKSFLYELFASFTVLKLFEWEDIKMKNMVELWIALTERLSILNKLIIASHGIM